MCFQNDVHDQETFHGVEEEHKKKIISRAGALHRTFRTRLRGLAKDSNGNYSSVPPHLYAHFSTVGPYWNQFVENSMKEEFVVCYWFCSFLILKSDVCLACCIPLIKKKYRKEV